MYMRICIYIHICGYTVQYNTRTVRDYCWSYTPDNYSTCDNRLGLLLHCMSPRFLWVHFWPGTVQSRSLQL